MKKIIFGLVAVILFANCSPSKKALYKQTDAFVESLQTTYDHYGLFTVENNSKLTEDSLYRVTPVGRLIIVKINKGVDTEEYEDLKEDLKDHYEGDSRVNDVYINKKGTVVIDCRN